MKKIILYFGLVLSLSMNAQMINGVPLDSLDKDYILISSYKVPFSNKVNVNLDFGQIDRVFRVNDTKVTNDGGVEKILNSFIDAINFMARYKYEVVQSWMAATGNNNQGTQYCLMKKNRK